VHRQAEYLVEHIRAALAERGPHHMGLAVQADEDEVRLRGPVDSEDQRAAILQVVADLAEGRRIVDDMECSPGAAPDVRIERLG